MNAAEVIPMPTNEHHQSAASQNISPASMQEVAGTGNIEKIRDILFGAQIREYERRFVRLEERIIKEAADAREDARRRFDSLEGFIKQEISALGDRLRSENQQRTQAAEDITRELRDASRSLMNKINAMDEHNTHVQRELRQQILDQAKNLADEIHLKHDDLSSSLQRESRELRNDKADRSALANLFTELAMRLNHEFKLPGEE